MRKKTISIDPPIEENLKSFPSAGECARPAFSAIRGYGSLMRVALPDSDWNSSWVSARISQHIPSRDPMNAAFPAHTTTKIRPQ